MKVIRTLVMSVTAGLLLAGSNGPFLGAIVGDESGCELSVPCDLKAVLDDHSHAYHPHRGNTVDDFFRLAWLMQ